MQVMLFETSDPCDHVQDRIRSTKLVLHAGSELYLIPGIDMVNHSTDPSRLNTSLHRREEAPQISDAALPSGSTLGFFVLETGKWHSRPPVQ